MASVLLKSCTACHEYTLQEVCPRCGAKAIPNRPAKFSPEDNFGDYRRKLKKLDAAKSATGAGKQATPSQPAARAAPASAGATRSATPPAKMDKPGRTAH